MKIKLNSMIIKNMELVICGRYDSETCLKVFKKDGLFLVKDEGEILLVKRDFMSNMNSPVDIDVISSWELKNYEKALVLINEIALLFRDMNNK